LSWCRRLLLCVCLLTWPVWYGACGNGLGRATGAGMGVLWHVCVALVGRLLL
jgi:hypothetical protein